MPAPSLLHLATATAIRFVKDLDDLGAMPYSLARPILLNIQNPEKLHAMELASPHLAEEDEELWLELIKRDIPDWEKYQLPENTNNWYGVYCDLCDQVQRSLDADAERMKMAIDGISAKRALLTPKLIPEGKGLRMAGSRPSVRQRHATYDRRMVGHDKKPSIFQPQKRNTALTMPTKSLNNRASQVKRAPIGLVEEHRRPTAEQSAPQPMSKPQPLAPRISRPSMLPPSLQHPMLARNEARLRALTSTASSSSSPSPRASSSNAPSATKSPAVATEPKLKRRATSPPHSTETPSSASLPAPPTSSLPSSRPPSSGPPLPRPGVIRRRPAPSIFMPAKRRNLS
ncbi:RNA polymerase II transcription factor SIII subunit A [Penicillium cf. griseofulvum]|uniref:RNA polymerase II transcription factor SIII subunit A n=1 Tax=Penicillium cf. griseofulvum TaxID=2972120 RepID=A0A9W9T2P0_9EURO|nr:RNA polymerase II transcription factor SIII subunit A [Penicillium cf. griseofulvum]KAJ5446028.1 RNA polymerase II transcription factor SIII subunit A [Penicillium cf. griseofulvum]